MTVCAIKWVSCPQMNLFQFLGSAKRVYFEDKASTEVLLGRKQLAPSFCAGTQTVCSHNVLLQILASRFMSFFFLKKILSAGY